MFVVNLITVYTLPKTKPSVSKPAAPKVKAATKSSTKTTKILSDSESDAPIHKSKPVKATIVKAKTKAQSESSDFEEDDR